MNNTNDNNLFYDISHNVNRLIDVNSIISVNDYWRNYMERALNLRNNENIVLDNSNINMSDMINQNNQNNQNNNFQRVTSERTSYIDDTVMRERVMNFINNPLLNSMFRSRLSVHNNDNLYDIINMSFNEEPKYKNVLSEKGSKEIKKIKYNKEEHELTQCPITMEEFEEGEEISILPCNHIFKNESIEKWLKEEDASCPICRFKLDSREVSNENEEEEDDDMPDLISDDENDHEEDTQHMNMITNVRTYNRRDNMNFIRNINMFDSDLQNAIMLSLRDNNTVSDISNNKNNQNEVNL